ncbi:MAG: phosphoribosylformylglycinamidine synthase subunit PurL [Thermoleophilia bacterium]|nr:phosphoribosylformylglycinamidine synthase subunit PurL [Thermoleophilia bacterium]
MSATNQKPAYELLGLKEKEYQGICDAMGREPNYTELAVFSLMWSEHCGYKHSRPLLKNLPTEGERILQGPGENAGIIDIGDNLAIAMKIESHNHPSAIEPFQGAATGIGGIVRDIFAMGARPIANLDPLHFGPLEKSRQKYLLEGVVEGIAAYGNCMGIPTVAGEIHFEDAYEGNCLINVMCVGLVEQDKILRAKAEGPGNLVLLFGSTTGRDGIGGASILASAEFDETAQEKRPTVQVGDPFTEKKLLEACLEMRDKGLLVALQDLGAAGLSSSSSEMASKGGVGIDMDISKVPLREQDMEPFEIMISESQERMLAVVTPELETEALAVCEKWDLDAVIIGKITDTKRMRVFLGDELVADMPVDALVDDAPTYIVEAVRPAHEVDDPLPEDHYRHPTDLNETLTTLLRSPNICDKRWVYEQYDHMVQTNNAIWPGAESAVLRIKGRQSGVALTTDGNGRRCYLDPRRGARAVVAEAARNLSCTGAKPLAVTNCLNFGNPEKGEIYHQFREAVEGMAEACLAFETPVTGGNVSFYNESFGQAVYPNPVVGMMGLVEDVRLVQTPGFKDEGDVVLLLGNARPAADGSEYQLRIHGEVAGRIPDVDLEMEKKLQLLVREAILEGLVKSAHDVSDGGLACCLAESAIDGGHGAVIELASSQASQGAGDQRSGLQADQRPDLLLFGEAPGLIVVTVEEKNLEHFAQLAQDLPAHVIGRVEGDRLVVQAAGVEHINIPVAQAAQAWGTALETLIGDVG